MRYLITALVLASLSVGLTGCGVRGPLEAPQEALLDPTAEGMTEKQKKASKEHRGFVLDGLL